MMWPTVLFGLLLASVAGWIITAYFRHGGFEAWNALMKKFRSKKRLFSISYTGLAKPSGKPFDLRNYTGSSSKVERVFSTHTVARFMWPIAPAESLFQPSSPRAARRW